MVDGINLNNTSNSTEKSSVQKTIEAKKDRIAIEQAKGQIETYSGFRWDLDKYNLFEGNSDSFAIFYNPFEKGNIFIDKYGDREDNVGLGIVALDKDCYKDYLEEKDQKIFEKLFIENNLGFKDSIKKGSVVKINQKVGDNLKDTIFNLEKAIEIEVDEIKISQLKEQLEQEKEDLKDLEESNYTGIIYDDIIKNGYSIEINGTLHTYVDRDSFEETGREKLIITSRFDGLKESEIEIINDLLEKLFKTPEAYIQNEYGTMSEYIAEINNNLGDFIHDFNSLPKNIKEIITEMVYDYDGEIGIEIENINYPSLVNLTTTDLLGYEIKEFTESAIYDNNVKFFNDMLEVNENDKKILEENVDDDTMKDIFEYIKDSFVQKSFVTKSDTVFISYILDPKNKEIIITGAGEGLELYSDFGDIEEQMELNTYQLKSIVENDLKRIQAIEEITNELSQKFQVETDRKHDEIRDIINKHLNNI